MSLPDQYVLLLQNVVEENRLLRAQMANTISSNESALKNIETKMDILSQTTSPGRRVRQTGQNKHKVPKACSNNVRRKLKALRSADENMHFRLTESPDSQQNSQLFKRVAEELQHEFGGQENCPWPTVVLKEAFKRYFKSCKAKQKRVALGTEQQHVQICRRRSRKEEKLARRLKTIEKMGWNQTKVAKVADVMRMDYMSSEKSEVDEETNRIKHYKVRKLSWESRELKRTKKKLDKNHKDSLPGLSKRAVTPREEGEPSGKPKPANCPGWACVVLTEDPTNEPVGAQYLAEDDLNLSR
ncbi:uncharacterized protein LOC114544620 [Dendronephthya gigantea]|uniref:uncharacterized protein LOC114539580 n=2 Tax=Dendronephthya gigantea TaxID=151771 RepID=UPI00106D051D|nr:uncharacterized protein LOC114539580 [Dendronephthya gigantea]XP_028416024.1 uncharacterized protein LOC114539580 [Dendronephthya gigantea]XP_028417214.1 uncharacterized protein LOC114541497 [Dendronephthya gigantea]XP_028418050.1 uncharacterized protein LOC114542829 [Dendronephthya gigantea]XP_028418051.1 uncharacterized protein LOC114542829 [Dendronephthya gigantea]XP_028419004.1 uncharacterized protein LOC114544620 [Dendronephthya gigantea]